MSLVRPARTRKNPSFNSAIATGMLRSTLVEGDPGVALRDVPRLLAELLEGIGVSLGDLEHAGKRVVVPGHSFVARRTSGSEDGPRKRTGRKTGTAPRSDPTTPATPSLRRQARAPES